MGYRVRQPWSTTALALGFPLPPPLACHCPHPWSTKEGSMCPRPRVQESKQGPRAQVPKGPRSRRVQESKDPRVKGLNLLRIQGLQGSKGPGSRGLMVQGSRGTRGSTRTHEVPVSSRGPKDPRDWVLRTKGPKTQGSTGQGSTGQGPSDNQPCIRATGQAHDLFLKKFVCQPVAQRATITSQFVV